MSKHQRPGRGPGPNDRRRRGGAPKRGGARGTGRPVRPTGARRDLSDREVLREAEKRRPKGGWSLDDFDDIPMPASAKTPARSGGAKNGAAGPDEGRVRLQKALANAGIASRRASEDLITRGRVEVNGQIVTELGTRIDPEADEVFVDGQAVQFDVSKRYVMLNKPRGVVSSMKDEKGRPDLRQFTKQFDERIYNVGRLDGDTSGLLVLTNDGELANVLAHPSFGVEKTYVARVEGRMNQGTAQKLLRGIELEDGPIKADGIKIVQATRDATLVEITLHSGRNRIVRRMLAAVGHPVTELVRRSFGPLHLGTLKVGEMRELSAEEHRKLLTMARRAQKRSEHRANPAKTPSQSREGRRDARPRDKKDAS